MQCRFSIAKLEQMSRYLDSVNSAIQDSQKQLLTDLEAVAKNIDEEEKIEFYNFYEDDLIEIGSNFPILFFSSFLIGWYSLIEHELTSLCKVLDLKILVSIQDDLRYGEGIRRAYKFLDKSVGYKIYDVHWQELVKIGRIRNKLVHEGGLLIPKPTKSQPSVQVNLDESGIIYVPIDEELYRYLSEHSLYHLGELNLTPNYFYCKHLVDFGIEFLTKIYKDFDLTG